MSRKIGVVTVLYNSESVLEEFFETLSIQSYKNFVLYVVDNLSPDGSLGLSKKLAEDYQFETVIIENNDNYGVAKGNNIGIRRALKDHCDLVLLSNNDIVLEKNTIELLLQGMEKHNADMVVPKIYYYKTSTIWSAGGYFNKWKGHTIHSGFNTEDIGKFDSDRKISYAPTCFMLIEKEVFSNVGLMDENYFVYYDDTDFVYRSLNLHKKTLWYIYNSLIEHNESTSTGKMSDFSVRYLYRNLVYFSLKNYNFVYALYILTINFLYNLTVLFFKWPQHTWRLALKSYFEGIKVYVKAKNKKYVV